MSKSPKETTPDPVPADDATDGNTVTDQVFPDDPAAGEQVMQPVEREPP